MYAIDYRKPKTLSEAALDFVAGHLRRRVVGAAAEFEAALELDRILHQRGIVIHVAHSPSRHRCEIRLRFAHCRTSNAGSKIDGFRTSFLTHFCLFFPRFPAMQPLPALQRPSISVRIGADWLATL